MIDVLPSIAKVIVFLVGSSVMLLWGLDLITIHWKGFGGKEK